MNDNDVPANDRHWMGEFTPAHHYGFQDTIGGRFVISHTHNDVTIVDLFHSKTTELRLDLSLATENGVPLESCNQYKIEGAYALDLSTVIVLLRFSHNASLYLGVARTDLERSLIIVHQTIRLSTDQFNSPSLFPLSYPPNLHEGLIFWKSSYSSARGDYFLVKMDTDNQLQASRINVPVKMKPFGEPDKLSDLVWLRLKRIFDARPLAYEYILSQLPANFKPKCPFPQP
ncbi:hypothetical protein M3Y95_01183700 [Aphelenchoides besseyi]|nr:hypothetical protein M3Y95_01183700 [Aphelenchoides besseyi]